MKMLEGYKRWIGLAVGALGVLGISLGFLTEEQFALVEGVAVVIFGAGWVDAEKRGQSVMKDLLAAIKENAPKVLLAGLALGLALAASPSYAADCHFARGLDAKVIRVAWPPAIGINALGFLDLEAGLNVVTACGNASANLVGGACLIPKVDGLLGPLCPKQDTGGPA